MNERKPSQAGRIVVTVLLAIFLLFSALATVLLGELRCLTRKETLKTVITQAITSSGGASGSGSVTGSAAPAGNGTVAGEIMDNLCDYAAEELNSRLGAQVESPEVRELLAQSTLPDFLAEKISLSLSGESAKVTQQEVETLLTDNQEVIEKALGQPMTEDIKQQILSWAAENADDLVDSVQGGLEKGRPGVRRGAAVMPAAAETSVFSLISSLGTASIKALVICAIMCLVWTVLLIVVNRRFLATGLCVSGAMYLVAGALCALALLLGGPQLGIPLQPMLPPVLLMLALALVLLLSGVVLGTVNKKKQKAAA